MDNARERVQSLDSRLRELEERFVGLQQPLPSLPALPDLPSTAAPTPPSVAVPPAPPAPAWPEPAVHSRAPVATALIAPTPAAVAARPNLPAPAAEVPAAVPAAATLAPAASRAQPANDAPPAAAAQLAPQGPPQPAPAAPYPILRAAPVHTDAAAPRPSRPAEVPLRLYREGLPHRSLGPPQSVWEADKNAAVLALSQRVRDLEQQLTDVQPPPPQEHAPQQLQLFAAPLNGVPPPPIDLLPVERTVLGATRHAHEAAFGGVHSASGRAPAPVTYYPADAQQPLTAEAALMRLQAAQGPRGHAKAFAASVTAAAAAATVPSVMMRRKENAPPPPPPPGDSDDAGGGSSGGGGARRGALGPAAAGHQAAAAPSTTAAVGVSAPLGHASTAASAAASLHTAALREPGGPLQPAGRYPMVAAALAAGTPGTGGSTWEQGKMRALLSLEQERDVLLGKLSSLQDQEGRHRRQMVELNEAHRKEMLDAAGKAGQQLERLMGSAWRTYARRLMVLRVTRALHAWRRIAFRKRRLEWALRVWRRRALDAAFVEWRTVVLARRHERTTRRRAAARRLRSLFRAWRAAATERARLRRLENRVGAARRRWLLAAWSQRTQELVAARLRVRGAEAHRRRVLLRHAWRRLAGEVLRVRAAEAALRQRLDRAAAVAAFATWVRQARLARRLRAMHRRAVLRAALRAWAAHAARSTALQRKARVLAGVWRRRRRAIFLAAWATAARREARLGAAYRALCEADRRCALAEALACLRLPPREREWGRRRARAALRAWHAAAARSTRQRRIVLVRMQYRARTLAAAVFDAWRVRAKAGLAQLHLREIHRLQDLEPTYEHQMELVRQDRAAVQSHMRALMAEANLLRAELLRGWVAGAEGGLLGKPLRWRSLPADPGQWCPPPRSRHSALCLRALQLPPAPPPGAASHAVPLPVHGTMGASSLAASGGALHSSGNGNGNGTATGRLLTGTVGAHAYHGGEDEAVIPGVGGVLLVFGGVGEDVWYRDLHVLEVQHTEGGGASFRWHGVEVAAVDPDRAAPDAGAAGQLGGGGGEEEDGAHEDTSGSRLPLRTRRDHAACVTSPDQFVVVGGFDGSHELMDIHAVTVRAAGGGVGGWGAEVQPVPSRNRTPPGRSHHSATCHPAGRSLYVFGGYASARGVLGELWAFHLDHREWWQPGTTGDAPPPRRNHVAALVGGRLVVHGGFDGARCLGDTWVLDPETWHWERLETTGPAPSPRRGHAAEVLDDRYLLVHGGYDGGAPGVGHLFDGAVLDLHTASWWTLAAKAGPEDLPSARCHHSLSLVGHVVVALGGSGPLGPLLDVHLLESPSLTAGLAQQHRLMATAAQLSATQAGMADAEAALAVTRHRAELAEQQLHLLRERSAELLSQHNAALADMGRLRDKLAAEALRVAAAEAAAADAALAKATVERRLRRTREGGHEVAAAARDMHDTLCELREEVAHLRGQLLSQQQQHGRESAQLAAAAAERQLLGQQLAGSQQESALLRGMLATAEAEFRAALDRQRGAMESELAAAGEHARQLAVAAAGVAGGAAAAGSAADMDLVLLHQLAAATARAETAELRLAAMEREHGALQAEGAGLKRAAAQQARSREAAEERAAAAMSHMHASELRYQQQVEDLQRQLAEAQRERWRADLGLAQHAPPRKRAATEPPSEAATGAGADGAAVKLARPAAAAEEEEDGEVAARAAAEALLRAARPPPPDGPLEQPARRRVAEARVSVVADPADPADPAAHFTVQHVEQLLLDDPALGVLPEVARLLALQRRLLGTEGGM